MHLCINSEKGRLLRNESLESRDEGGEHLGTRILSIIPVPNVPHEIRIAAEPKTELKIPKSNSISKADAPSHDLHRQYPHPRWSLRHAILLALGLLVWVHIGCGVFLGDNADKEHQKDLGFCDEVGRELFEQEEDDAGAA